MSAPASAGAGGTADTAAAYAQYVAAVSEILASSRTFISVCNGVLVWEWLSTVRLEYLHVWRHSFGHINILYPLVRYGTLAEMSIICYMWYWPNRSAAACQHIYLLEAYFHVGLSALASLIFILRAYALWGKSKFIVAILGFFLLLQIAIQSWVPHASKPFPVPPPLSACIPGGTHFYWLYWLSELVFSVVLSGLTVYRSIDIWRQGGRLALNAVILRDALLFFVLYLLCNLANMIYYTVTSDQQNRAFLAPLVATITSISAGRVIFNLRSASENPSSSAGLGSSGLSSSQPTGRYTFDTSPSHEKQLPKLAFRRFLREEAPSVASQSGQWQSDVEMPNFQDLSTEHHVIHFETTPLDNHKKALKNEDDARL